MDELADFARRRPGVFLLGAGLLGVVAGRLTRGLRADSGRPSPQPVISHPRGADPVSVPDAAGTYVNTPSSYASEGGGVSGGTYAADELTSPVPTEAYTEAADEDAGQRR